METFLTDFGMVQNAEAENLHTRIEHLAIDWLITMMICMNH